MKLTKEQKKYLNKWEHLSKEELNKVLFQLKAQQDLLDRVEKHKVAISDLRAKVNEIENKCEESENILRNAEKKSLRKMWFWMILGCISISSIISYVIVTLCK